MRAMSRHKENKPLFSSQRNGLLTRNLPSEDFFTDSLLDDSRISNNSLIPSPSKPKVGAAKPRRAIPTSKALFPAKDAGNRTHRSALVDYVNAQTSKQLKPSPKPARKKSPSAAPTNELTTPPQSRDGPPMRSPSEFSSPPGGLHESYQRIADEEDLAATERDVESDQDDLEDERQDTFELNVNTNPANAAASQGPDISHPSEHSTPVQSPLDQDDRTSSYSAPPTMGTLDFIQNEMSDRVLAAKLTPHVVDRARDRERLLKLRQGAPINFGDANISKQNNGGHRNDLASIAARGPISFDNLIAPRANGLVKAISDPSSSRKIQAFRLAGRSRKQEREPADDSGSDTPDELREVERTLSLSRANRRRSADVGNLDDQAAGPPPKFKAFSRAYGRPRPFGGSVQTYDDQQPAEDPTVASVSSARSEPISMAGAPQRDKDSARKILAQWRRETVQRKADKAREGDPQVGTQIDQESAPERPVRPQDDDENQSDIDWVIAGADVPLPSIEKSSTPRNTPPPKVLPSPISRQKSLDRVRRWENNDFTGMSFQVSESPPVRSRSNLNDSLREKEIEDLTKKAVTSNRLDQIRVKDPNVVVRKSPRNFSAEERRSGVLELAESQVDDDEVGRQETPDTPIAVLRSSSHSAEKSRSSEGSMPDSLDQLKRLARAVSTTPKASPVQSQMIREVEEASAISLPPSEEEEVQVQAPKRRANGVHQHQQISETPRVAGAWTDTILPETIRAQKQPLKLSKYAQTPHVSAGGWVDTPLPNGDRAPVPSIPEIVEEETGEIEKHEPSRPVQDPTEAEDMVTQPPAAPAEDQQPQLETSAKPQQLNLLPSALTNVLNEAKQKRLVSGDITEARPSSRDDTETLNLGEATIQSMEDLLNDSMDITMDLTTIIKANAQEEIFAFKQRQSLLAADPNGEDEASEVVFIGHLSNRIERLVSNLHEARKGITRLEQKVSHTPAATLMGADYQNGALTAIHDPTQQTCKVCGQSNNGKFTSHVHTTKMTTFLSLPIAHTTFTLPIPLLFHRSTTPSKSQSQSQLSRFLPGRPTWLGYLTITLWTWYILECLFTELYARPILAEKYAFPPPGIREPEFPLALPTMLYRWSLGTTGLDLLFTPLMSAAQTLLGAIVRLSVAIYRILAMSLGWTDGFVEDARAGNLAAVATNSAIRAAKSLLPGSVGAGDGLSMMNDEIL